MLLVRSAGTRLPASTIPERFSGSAAESRTSSPFSGCAGRGAVRPRLGQSILLAGKPGYEPAPSDQPPGLETTQSPEYFAPRHGQVLVTGQVPEDDAPAGQELAGDVFGQLVRGHVQ